MAKVLGLGINMSKFMLEAHRAHRGERMPLIMGILNVTPDSLSDGGRFMTPDLAARQARALFEQGADCLDIGAESTRPQAQMISQAEERARLFPMMEAVLGAIGDLPISLDTRRADIFGEMISTWPDRDWVWNDVSALRFEANNLQCAASFGRPVILMHAKGDGHILHGEPVYGDVVADIACWLENRARQAIAAGLSAGHIVLDPGIGFGKQTNHNLALLRHLDSIVNLGFPVLVGASRKRFIGEIAPAHHADMIPQDIASDRLAGTIAAGLWANIRGVALLRVHDVERMRQALQVWEAIAQAERPAPVR